MNLTDRYKSLPPALQRVLPYLILLGAVFGAYANTYGNAFLFDDDLIISRNELLHSWDTFFELLTASTTTGVHIAGGFYRPVQLILYFLIYQFFGYSTVAFHLLNVSIHALNGCLMYALGRKLKFNPIGAFLASLLWAVHPLHTEAVTYMSATADPLFVAACLGGCLILLPDASPRRVLLALPIFCLGFLSKETAVVFPALAILSLALVNPKLTDYRPYLRTWPLWVVGAIYLIWRMGNDQLDGPSRYQHMFDLIGYQTLKLYANDFSYRTYTFLATLPSYAMLLLCPTDLHMERAFPIFTEATDMPVVIGLLMLTSAVGQIIWGHGKRGTALSWGFLWFGAAHFPDTGLLTPSNSLFLEHWMYLPSIGLFLGFAESLYALSTRIAPQRTRPALATLTLTAVTVASVLTFQQNAVWHDPVSFYTNIFKYGPATARAHNNLALAYMDQKDIPKALEEFQVAIKLEDVYAETRHNYALALLRLHDGHDHTDEAISNLNRALEIDPHFYRAFAALGAIYAYRGDPTMASYYNGKAIEAERQLRSQ